MIELPFKSTRRIIIDPGEYYATKHQEVISTLLGSCVSACLFDPVNRVFGMNHFLLSYRHHSQNKPILLSEEGRYGVYAMELLINELMKMGANRHNLKAKCFGGGNVLKLREDRENKDTVGDVNIMFIREFLKIEKIPIVNSCLGGNHGRYVHFVGSDYSVFVKKIGDQQQRLLENEEHLYWKKRLDAHEKSKGNIDIW